MRIAYFINQYPKVSHSFIRREILAIERLGAFVQRISLRGWDNDLFDAEDLQERRLTQYVLQVRWYKLLLCVARVFFCAPRRFFSAFRLSFEMSCHADKPLPFHIVYFAEACCVLLWLRGNGAEHVHAHFGTNSTEVVMLTHALGGPSFSFTVHGPEEFDKPHFLHLGEKLRRAAFVVAISSYGRSQLYRCVDHAHWSKIKVVHCGLEQSFHSAPSKPITKAPRLVCVGRLCEQKGQLLLVEAVHELTLKGVEIELVLAGDGEMRSDVEHLVQMYDLTQRIRITGWISSDQVRDEILASRGLVLPKFR